MKFSILCENKNLYSTQRLSTEILKLGHKCQFLNPRKDPFKNCDIAFHRCNGIYFDDKDLEYSKVLMKNGSMVLNNPHSLQKFRDKLDQARVFTDIEHLSFNDKINQSDIKFKKDHLEFICKTTRGCKGIGVHYFGNKSELVEFFNTSDFRYIIQPFIKALYEVRCFFIGNEIWTIKKTINSRGSFNFEDNNIEIFKNQELERRSLEIAQKVDYFYGAIDYLITKDQSYFLEINANPGLKSIEQVSGINIAKKIVKKSLISLKNLQNYGQ